MGREPEKRINGKAVELHISPPYCHDIVFHIELLNHRFAAIILQFPPERGYHLRHDRRLLPRRHLQRMTHLRALGVERDEGVLVGGEEVRELELVQPYASRAPPAATRVLRHLVERGLAHVPLVAQRELVQLQGLGPEVHDARAQVGAVAGEQNAQVRHVQ